jgi:hypothetical protein
MSFTIEEINTSLVKISSISDGQYFRYDADDEISPSSKGYWLKCCYAEPVTTGQTPVTESYVLNLDTFEMKKFSEVFKGTEEIYKYNTIQYDTHYISKSDKKQYTVATVEKDIDIGNLLLFTGSEHIVANKTSSSTDGDNFVIVDMNTGIGSILAKASLGDPNVYIISFTGSYIDLYLS